MKNKIIVFGKKSDEISKLLKECGFVVVQKSPDFIVSFGGDGTIMRSENKYPEIPKIILKNSRVCKLCSSLKNN